mmetsp:Transcript_5273/g.14969  ORF Transcript_5273/g.14969 Transcript_5273/m.14969 type:complete len:1008 (-) Transcript_5273:204-3227(-)|eukprot:CAMPEP_0181031806 /NCGR_PEP_ID=MMETSP1070-20121207/6421_1 /TAXON_ID=265543 /ORGANISM="Minutocellus polymorphus, Strain NH13" /LENGTH=1007 /DNA_ID=CAMNT_0023109193 /DNA_START=174 /DNA_END=3197 /DNA_ORIENTATION=-
MANPSSMDDLNLDNLFGGDDLFGGLDEIDLDGFDDISSLGGSARRRGGQGGGFGFGVGVGAVDGPTDSLAAAVAAPPPAFDEISFDLSTIAPSIDRASSLSPQPFPSVDQRLSPNQYQDLNASGSTKKSQRKRKAKKFLGDDDDSDDGSSISVGMGTKSAKATKKGKGKQSGGSKKGRVGKKDNKAGATSADAAARSTSPVAESSEASPQMMPPPLPRPGQSGVNVASLPRYLEGSAVFESGQSGQTSSAALVVAPAKEEPSATPPSKKSKSKSKKHQTDTLAGEGSPSDAQAATSTSASPAVDPTYCGLEPNTTLFYPFMPLSAEVGMRRLQKAFPELEKVHVHLIRTADAVTPGKSAAAMNGAAETATSVPEDNNNPLFRLFVDHLGALDASQSSSKAAAAAAAASSANGSGEAQAPPEPEEININIHKHLGEARKEILGTKNAQLREEVMKVLLLIRRQSNFLGTSLSNMDTWCKEHLSESEYAEGFEDETPGTDKHSKQGTPGSNTFRSSGHILPVLTSTTPVFVNIRVKCKGFRESASQTARLNGGPLVAQLPIPPDVAHGTGPAGTTPPTKRRRKSSSGVPSMASNISYEFLTIPERRRLVARAISTQAFELEARQKEVTSKRNAFRKEYSDKIAQIIKDDPIQVCHTTTLWQIMKHSPYILDINEEDIREGLAEAWQPELGSREMHWGEIPAVRIFRSHPSRKRKRDNKEEVGQKKESGAQMPPTRLFDRLQSLLVDVGSDDDDDSGADPDPDMNGIKAVSNGAVGNVNPRGHKDSFVNSASFFVSDPSLEPPLSTLAKSSGETLLDLSKLSLDQRAYIQLRALGLADAPLLPSLLPIVEEEVFVPVSKPVSVNGGAKKPTSVAAAEEKIAATLPESVSSAASKSNGAAADSAGTVVPSSSGTKHFCSDNDADLCDDLDTIIRRMQDDLSGMHRSINMRAASLHASAEEQLYEQRRVKRREEECSSLVAKHSQLVKKKKEAQNKKIPPKSSKEHEDWLPW